MLDTEPEEEPIARTGSMIGGQMSRLARQSLVYGVGPVVSKFIAVFMLPLYTSYLVTKQYGVVALLMSAEVVAVIVFRAGIQNAFFRFYYLSNDPLERRTIVRTSFWFTMTSATAGLVLGLVLAPEIASALALHPGQTNLVRATAVLLWGDMNYQQLTAVFRVEQRSVSYAIASVANVFITVAATVTLIVWLHQGSLGLIIGNFTGTLCVFTVLLAYRANLLGFEFDRKLYRAMEHFGLPLLPSILALWVTRFSDRFFIQHFLGPGAVGVYSFGVQISSVLMLIITAFLLAWPAFAYSIEDDGEARHTYAYVLTYFLFFMIWASVALSLLAPVLAHLLGHKAAYHPGARFVPVLAFACVLIAGYEVVTISIGRVRKTGMNWVITGSGALVDIILNWLLIPRVGAMGAAIALLAGYATMFVGMSWHAQRLFPVPYQWRRVATMVVAGVGIVLVGKWISVSAPLAVALAAAFPFLLIVLGFYSAPERARVAALVRRVLRLQTV
ncbi:MAG: oligosaccharide flippase family protein [Gaiellaceae bacterium]|jgi:O-antigen/teichoic acid export membrane protein